MKVSDLVVPVIEPVTGRYNRDLLNLNDDRKVRGFDYEAKERRDRRYVDPDTGDSVAATGDNNPAGFNREAFEDSLVDAPSVAATAVAGTPGTFEPTGATAPANLADLDDVTAEPTTAWTTGQHVVLGDNSQAYWNGTAWVAGTAA